VYRSVLTMYLCSRAHQVFKSVLKTLAVTKLWHLGADLCDLSGRPLPKDGKIYTLKGKQINEKILDMMDVGRERLLVYIDAFYFKTKNSAARPSSIVAMTLIPALQESLTKARTDEHKKLTSTKGGDIEALMTSAEINAELTLFRENGMFDNPPGFSALDKEKRAEILAHCRKMLADGGDTAAAPPPVPETRDALDLDVLLSAKPIIHVPLRIFSASELAVPSTKKEAEIDSTSSVDPDSQWDFDF